MAKIVDGLKLSAGILIFAICFSATQSVDRCPAVKQEQRTTCQPGWEGPSCNKAEGTTSYTTERTTSYTSEAITTDRRTTSYTRLRSVGPIRKKRSHTTHQPKRGNYCDDALDKIYDICWVRTMVGKDISHPCPENAIGNCTRKCNPINDTIAGWSEPNCNSCFDIQFNTLLEQLKTIDLKRPTEFANIARNLSAFTNRTDAFTSGNLNASIMIIKGLAEFRYNNDTNSNEKEIKSVVQTISNILQPNNSESWAKLQAVNSTVASAILFSAEVYGQSLAKLYKSWYSIEKADFLVLEAWSLEKSNLSDKLEFPTHPFSGENSSDIISLSLETLKNRISTGNTLNIWGLYYQTINDYLPGKKDTDNISSKILSFSIGGLQKKEKLIQPVIITLKHNQEKKISFRRTCAFWNFDSGEWDSTGCCVTSTNLTHTICSCDHLTNFAILMSRYPSYDKALSILSIVGCSISVIGLILTVIVYAVTWKQSKSDQAAVLINLCVALIIAYIIFMAGADKVDPKNGCTAVAVLLHYFFLAAFFIMLAEGVELLLYIIFVFHVRTKKETILLIVAAWVLPLIIVAVSLGSTKLEGYGNCQACWLSIVDGLIWAFVAPVLCIITVNFVILVFVLRRISRKSSIIANNAKRNEMRATIWNLSVTCPVLGLGWLFGLLTVTFSSVVFQYLFVIANSLQGLFIFIFHVLLHNKKMSEKISHISSNYCSCHNQSYSVPTEMISSQEPVKITQKLDLVSSEEQKCERMETYDNLACAVSENTSI